MRLMGAMKIIIRVGAANKFWDWKYFLATLLKPYAGSPRSSHLR